MSQFAFDFEWESPEGARGEELRATWAHLKVRVGDAFVTRIDSLASGSVRNGIYLPLYPIAEWIASNWWPLLHEVPSQRSAEVGDYCRRHNLQFAAEGFAFPDLTIQPEGKRIILEWRPASQPLCRVEFLEGGRTALEREEVESALYGFVQAVQERLEDQGVTDTFLAREWKAITEAGKDEREFCMAVGHLGGDPYSPDVDEYADALIEFSGAVPADIAEEFLAVANRDTLLEQGAAIKSFIDRAEMIELNLDPMLELRKACSPFRESLSNVSNPGVTPWGQGYESARKLRHHLRLSSDIAVPTPDDIGVIFGLNPNEWNTAHSGTLNGLNFAVAAMAPTRDTAPFFAVRANPDSRKVFALLRAIFEYLFAPQQSPALVTDASSERQKRNRAFAAEFIAPAEGISKIIGRKSFITGDEIGSMAAQFGTSESVIHRQIQNHRLATIYDTPEF